MRTLQQRVSILGVERQGLLDQRIPPPQRRREAGLPIVGYLELGNEEFCLREVDIRRRKLRVEGHGAFEVLGRRLYFGDVAGREQGPALQKSEVGLQVRRALTGHALLRLRVERELERLRDLHGDLVLDREDVTGPPVE